MLFVVIQTSWIIGFFWDSQTTLAFKIRSSEPDWNIYVFHCWKPKHFPKVAKYRKIKYFYIKPFATCLQNIGSFKIVDIQTWTEVTGWVRSVIIATMKSITVPHLKTSDKVKLNRNEVRGGERNLILLHHSPIKSWYKFRFMFTKPKYCSTAISCTQAEDREHFKYNICFLNKMKIGKIKQYKVKKKNKSKSFNYLKYFFPEVWSWLRQRTEEVWTASSILPGVQRWHITANHELILAVPWPTITW